tara:strand:+ start:7497 stop:7823 length:327 start_codon:yes stop_codon:yes gene_type:complete
MLYKTLEDNSKIIIGQNAKENWDLIDKAEPEWTWFHLKSFPSSHVVLCCPEPTEQNLLSAAIHCKDSTKYKNVPHIKVSYCKINNIKKSDKIGSVSYVSKRKVKEIKP